MSVLYECNTFAKANSPCTSVLIVISFSLPLLLVFHGPLQAKSTQGPTQDTDNQCTGHRHTHSKTSMAIDHTSRVTYGHSIFLKLPLGFNYTFFGPSCQFVLTKYLPLSMSSLVGSVDKVTNGPRVTRKKYPQGNGQTFTIFPSYPSSMSLCTKSETSQAC